VSWEKKTSTFTEQLGDGKQKSRPGLARGDQKFI